MIVMNINLFKKKIFHKPNYLGIYEEKIFFFFTYNLQQNHIRLVTAIGLYSDLSWVYKIHFENVYSYQNIIYQL